MGYLSPPSFSIFLYSLFKVNGINVSARNLCILDNIIPVNPQLKIYPIKCAHNIIAGRIIVQYVYVNCVCVHYREAKLTKYNKFLSLFRKRSCIESLIGKSPKGLFFCYDI